MSSNSANANTTSALPSALPAKHQVNTFARAFTWPNVMYVGLHMLLYVFVMGWKLGGGKIKEHILYMLLTYMFVSFMVYVFETLDNNEDEQVEYAGIWGYGAVGVLLLLLALRYLWKRRKENESLTDTLKKLTKDLTTVTDKKTTTWSV